MPTIVLIYSKHVRCVLRLLNRTDCYVWLYQNNFWLFMFEMHLISGITDGWQGANRPPAKLNVKTGPLPSLYFGIYYSFDFSRLLLFCVFRSVFRYIEVLCRAVQYQICYCFWTIFWVLSVGSLQLSFLLAQTSSYVTAPDQSKVVLEIRAMRRASSNILQ